METALEKAPDGRNRDSSQKSPRTDVKGMWCSCARTWRLWRCRWTGPGVSKLREGAV